MRQPSFINVYDALSSVEQLKHFLGVQHASDDTPIRVTLKRNSFEHAIPHIKIIAHNLPDLIRADRNLRHPFDLDLDLFGHPYMTALRYM